LANITVLSPGKPGWSIEEKVGTKKRRQGREKFTSEAGGVKWELGVQINNHGVKASRGKEVTQPGQRNGM